jgi:hypothetical protein
MLALLCNIAFQCNFLLAEGKKHGKVVFCNYATDIEEKKTFCTPSFGWSDNIKVDLKRGWRGFEFKKSDSKQADSYKHDNNLLIL